MSKSVVSYISRVIHTPCYKSQRDSINEREVEKLENAIAVHGYRGSSRCKHNGVVLIKPSDTELLKCVRHHKPNLIIPEPTLSFVADVKVVAHCPSGNRIVGCLYKDTNQEWVLFLLSFVNYNHQLF